MIDNYHPIDNNNNSSIPTKCSSCCCDKNSSNISDIEDLAINKHMSSISKANHIDNSLSNSGNKQIVIKQNIDTNRSLSHSLNSLSNTLKTISKSEKSLEAIENGSATKICTCQQSKSYPYCDSTHEIFNKETGSNISPLIIKINTSNSSTPKLNSSSNNINKKSTLITTTTTTTPNKKEEPISKDIITNNLRYFLPTSFRDQQNQNNYFTLEEISKHNSVDSCWMIILNKVYDITTYIPHHPGGNKALLRFAGKDGSENVQFHSKKMLEILNNNYFIGHLDKSQQKVEPSMCLIC